MKHLRELRRLTHAHVPVYVDPAIPYWFVPSTRLDRLLQGGTARDREEELWLERLDRCLARYDRSPYPGRSVLLTGQPVLRELWLHLTDTCNLSCSHCLFASSPGRSGGLPPDVLTSVMREAADSGCRLFYFTGGEPFVYPGFIAVLAQALALAPDLHLVVLTNGLLLKENKRDLARLDLTRVHFQVSVDGLRESHDRIRGHGSFDRLVHSLQSVQELRLNLTVATALNRENIGQLTDICRLAGDVGGSGIHLMFHLQRGKGRNQDQHEARAMAAPILHAHDYCQENGLVVDNLVGLQAQLFTAPGSRFDLSNMGWETMAVGPDGRIYPSPALVRVRELDCGPVSSGLCRALTSSPVLERIRACSLVDDPHWRRRPLELLTGGGDPDHSWVAGGRFTGCDPYLELYEELMLGLAARQARMTPDRGMFRLRMGDVRFDCAREDPTPVELTHCNCVLSLAGLDGHAPVRDFYGRAALRPNTDILNPDRPDRDTDTYIPSQVRQRSYGCGSPVRDAEPKPGETVVDLGSGSGVECFLAAREVGDQGRVIGVDMTGDMLDLARQAKVQVVRELGYDNIEFRHGFLENVPLPDHAADVVISNCVINLSPDKRRTFLEILRILRPGGRLVVADIVIDDPVPPEIARSYRLRGECLGGAMLQDDLVQMLEDCGFTRIHLVRRTLYREVAGHRFYSLTYGAEKPCPEHGSVRALYRGPHAALLTQSGLLLERGRIREIPATDMVETDETVFLLDKRGQVVNIAQESCSCGVAPEPEKGASGDSKTRRAVPLRRHASGCMVCGRELVYSSESTTRHCHFCGNPVMANSVCERGHYICDDCHRQEGVDVIRHICLTSREADMIRLLTAIRSHPSLSMHGPEHHALVPGVILAAVRNSGGGIGREQILAGIERGSQVPGGACGFWGNCGAAIGAGIAAAIVLEATPITPHSRQRAQEFAARILGRIAAIVGGRCCQRETWLALRETATLSKEFFGLVLRAEGMLQCGQYSRNRECIGKQCPLWRSRQISVDEKIIALSMAGSGT